MSVTHKSNLDATQNLGLRIRLRLTPTELAVLPWELLFHPDLENCVALGKSTSLLRYGEVPQALQPLHIQTSLRILAMSAGSHYMPGQDLQR